MAGQGSPVPADRNNHKVVHHVVRKSQSSRLREFIFSAEQEILSKRLQLQDAKDLREILLRKLHMLEHPDVTIERIIRVLRDILPKQMPNNRTSAFKPTSNAIHLDALPMRLEEYPKELLVRLRELSYGDIIHLTKEAMSCCHFHLLHCLTHGKESPFWAELHPRISKFWSFNLALACCMGPIRRAEMLSMNLESEEFNAPAPPGEI
jgi:hypothetical protein